MSIWPKITVVLGVLGLGAMFMNIIWPSLFAVAFGHWSLIITKFQRREGKGVALFGLGIGYLGLIPAALVLSLHLAGA